MLSVILKKIQTHKNTQKYPSGDLCGKVSAFVRKSCPTGLISYKVFFFSLFENKKSMPLLGHLSFSFFFLPTTFKYPWNTKETDFLWNSMKLKFHSVYFSVWSIGWWCGCWSARTSRGSGVCVSCETWVRLLSDWNWTIIFTAVRTVSSSNPTILVWLLLACGTDSLAEIS